MIDGSDGLIAHYKLDGNLKDKLNQNDNLILLDSTKAYASPSRTLKDKSSIMLPFYNNNL